MDRSMIKKDVKFLAQQGNDKYFSVPKSTSSLAQPDFISFLQYSNLFYAEGHYTNNGVLVRLLEQRLARFHKTEFCRVFCSGFWAIVLAIKTLAINGKKEILMPSLTYRRMADIAAWLGLKPRFCEVDPQTLAMSEQTVRQCINSETSLILAVHPIINCCDVKGILNLREEYNIPVLFDSVESVYESTSQGKIGGFGDVECFSLHASKLLNGFEGGYITTNNAEIAKKLSALRNFGFTGQDDVIFSGGMNAKLNEIHAAMALANLDNLEKLISDNKLRYEYYKRRLKEISGVRLVEFDETYPTSYKNILIELLDDWPFERDLTVEILNDQNILARAYYSPPLHKKAMNYPYIPTELPITDNLAKKFILLPCGDFITCDDIEKIILFLKFLYDRS
ncbi:DegT/DnrJ/EryC1/StrS aminotransferase family protein [Legionella israelensis]|uniref:DegT/DnrJ/EryC1/StrS aminotransferase family protein n=2 Tax=Legionella israelensis TaxID=454 RepID=A0AAX1EHC5_9GAMM|nr:DegT/DnrJ/EryC1/StrS aminotransferase family protein [Legionella israelensis]